MSENKGWIGVDLDGTLFEYHGWVGWNVFGAPITTMVERVRKWHAEGQDVKIVTARVGLPIKISGHAITYLSKNLTNSCHVTGEAFSDFMMARAIQAHCVEHIGFALSVQCYKDVRMISLWDDRAVQVVPNTGRTLVDDAEKVFTPDDAWHELIEKDDRNSPEEYPDMCLISADELRDFMHRAKEN